MIVALTGTPGCGKSSAAEILASRGFAVTTVEQLARKHGAIEGDEVDVDKLVSSLSFGVDELIIEGHLAHFLPVDLIVVLRCNPNILMDRLLARGYSDEKVRANVEAEAIDLILCEAVDATESGEPVGGRGGALVAEIDASEIDAKAVADIVDSVIKNGVAGHEPGKVDWSEVVLSWY